MRVRRKAARPAAAETAREPPGNDHAGELIGTEATNHQTRFQALYSGRTCLGFILNRGRSGYEAFDCDDKSIGIFETQQLAADTLSEREGRG